MQASYKHDATTRCDWSTDVSVGHVDDVQQEVVRHLVERRQVVLDLRDARELVTRRLEPLLLDPAQRRVLSANRHTNTIHVHVCSE